MRDPHLAKDRNALEKVQNLRANWLAISKWNSSYEELLDLTDLIIKPLQVRRLESKLGLAVQVSSQSLLLPR